jgi:hypothetical protein
VSAVETRTARIALVVAGAAAILVSTAGASPKESAAGTVAPIDRTVLMSYHDGDNVIEERFVHRSLTGTFTGTETSVSHFVIYPDGSADLTAVSTCSCSVEGRTGTVTFSERGTVTADAIIDVERKSIDASGGLEGLSARLEINGSLTAPPQLYTGRYTFGNDDD